MKPARERKREEGRERELSEGVCADSTVLPLDIYIYIYIYIYKLSTKSKEICFVDYFSVVTMLFGNKSYTLSKPV